MKEIQPLKIGIKIVVIRVYRFLQAQSEEEDCADEEENATELGLPGMHSDTVLSLISKAPRQDKILIKTMDLYYQSSSVIIHPGLSPLTQSQPPINT